MQILAKELALILMGIALQQSAAKEPVNYGFSLTTRDRVRSAGWWPTKGEPARNLYAGNEECEGCHRTIAATQATTPMFQAGVRARESAILRKHKQLNFQDGSFLYSLTDAPEGVTYSVTGAEDKNAAAVVWAFGMGKLGQTYVLEKDGAYFEGRVSFFTSLNALDITPGQSNAIPEGVEKALGNRLDDDTSRRCFSCHMTAVVTSGVLEPEKAKPGVHCEACHGPGATHVAAMQARQFEKGKAAIVNPADLSPVDSVDFCGACHRTWADVEVDMPADIGTASLRFQPYRLEESRCWGKGGDPRITCIACHNPHQPLVTELSAYDSKCLACHSLKTNPKGRMVAKTTCKTGTSMCVSCHMPKYVMKRTHSQFTDHFIRVVRTKGPSNWVP